MNTSVYQALKNYIVYNRPVTLPECNVHEIQEAWVTIGRQSRAIRYSREHPNKLDWNYPARVHRYNTIGMHLDALLAEDEPSPEVLVLLAEECSRNYGNASGKVAMSEQRTIARFIGL